MANYHTTKSERETIIRWDEVDHIATCYTTSPKMIRQMDKLVKEHPDEYQCIWTDESYGAKKYRCAAKYFSPRKPASEARRRAARANAGKLRKNTEKHSQLAAISEASHEDDKSIDPL